MLAPAAVPVLLGVSKSSETALLAVSQEVLPCAEYYKRAGFPIKKIVKFAAARDFTDLLVFNEDRKEVGDLGDQSNIWVETAAVTRGPGQSSPVSDVILLRKASVPASCHPNNAVAVAVIHN